MEAKSLILCWKRSFSIQHECRWLTSHHNSVHHLPPVSHYCPVQYYATEFGANVSARMNQVKRTRLQAQNNGQPTRNRLPSTTRMIAFGTSDGKVLRL